MADAAHSWNALRRHPLAQSLIARLPESVRGSPAKSAVLGGLVLVMGLLWARALLRTPAGAQAALVVKQTIQSTPTASAVGSTAPRDPSDRRSDAITAWLRAPADAAAHNAFAARPDNFPLATPETIAPPPAPSAQADEAAKSRARRADEQSRRAAAEAEFRRDAATLELSTTVMTRPPSAILNGRVVREGDAIKLAGGEGRVLRIEPRRVVVGRGEFAADVSMYPEPQKPAE